MQNQLSQNFHQEKCLGNMSTYCHSTIPSGCSSLESLDSTIQPELIRLSQLDGSLLLHIHNDSKPKELTETDELTTADINKIPTNWDGYNSRGGEIISKMANVTYVTSTKYYYTTPSTIATMPIWVKHYKT